MLSANFFKKGEEARMFWRAAGSFGEMIGDISREDNSVFKTTDEYKIECSYSVDECGVITRNDVFKNISDDMINLTSLKSRFVFDGGEYEVYTQYNNWLSESMGAWQPLVTSISASVGSTRSTQDATPFMVIWNKQQNRGVVIHILPNCAWEMKVSRIGFANKISRILVELGPIDYNMNLEVKPGEEIKLPQIICYETANRVDFDCYKLHNYMHTNYPRREMPTVYNTWLYRFTDFTPELLMEQAKIAAEMGIEYFIIDAGWFGRDGVRWFNAVGDWSENPVGAFGGNMKGFAEEIRKLGLKFGLWVEIERASAQSLSVKEHPEYYLKSNYRDMYFLDMANPDARKWAIELISDLVETYGMEYIKFDYNDNLYNDEKQSSLYRYYEGYIKFIEDLRKKYPDMYFNCCASGGMHTDLNNYIHYDSFWPSDNENPYYMMRLYKDTILRLPPQGFERWNCVHSLEKYNDFYKPFSAESGKAAERMVACGDALWYDIVGVHPSFMEAFHTGGPLCFSCDLTLISKEDRKRFAKAITAAKNRDKFWKKAVARKLCDTDTITVYQYSDMALTDIIVQVVSGEALQNLITVYPEVCEDKIYLLNGETKLSGKDIKTDGIDIPITGWNEMSSITLEEVM